MNGLQIFNSVEFGTIRTVQIENEPWFVAKDLTDKLGYANGRDAVALHVDEEDKANVGIYDGSQCRNMTIVNESGLYSLIFSSKLQTAKNFKHWVTSDVIPQIRKTGQYELQRTDLTPQMQMLYGMLDQMAETERQAREAKELAVKATETTEAIKEAIQPVLDDWRKVTNDKIIKITKKVCVPYADLRNEMYKVLEQRAGCDLGTRLRNLRSRVNDKGGTKTEVEKLCKMDVIESDKRLKEIFSKIVTEYEVKFCA